MNHLDKLFEVFNKTGEKRIFVLDRQTGEIYTLSKWDFGATEKDNLNENKTAPTENVLEKQDIPANLNEIGEPAEMFDEERFFAG